MAASPLALGCTGSADEPGTMGSTHRVLSGVHALWLSLGV